MTIVMDVRLQLIQTGKNIGVAIIRAENLIEIGGNPSRKHAIKPTAWIAR